MSNQESSAQYRNMENEVTMAQVMAEEDRQPKSLGWLLYALAAMLCFSFAGYILGIVSVGGAPAKFLASYGYLLISLLIIFTKNIKFWMVRGQLFKEEPQLKQTLSRTASLKDTCFYDEETGYKQLGLFLCVICGLLNLIGEFAMILSFQHALDSMMNQGILSTLMTLGAIVVLLGSVFILREHVRLCEYLGVMMIIAGVIILSFSKPGEGAVFVFDQFGNIIAGNGPLEGPGMAIAFGIIAAVSFGARGLTLKYMGIRLGIDGISASSIFLLTDGILGGGIGLIITLLGGGYASFSTTHIILGIVAGALAGTGVLCLNISIMTGLAGPAVAVANLMSVVQALLDMIFLGQVPNALEWIGLAIAIIGAIVMATADDYVIAPLFNAGSNNTKGGRNGIVDDEEITHDRHGEYKGANIQNQSIKKKFFLENETRPNENSKNGVSEPMVVPNATTMHETGKKNSPEAPANNLEKML